MQAYTQTPPVEIRLSAAQPTTCNMMPSSITQASYYNQQQIMLNQQSNGLWNSQSSSQPVLNLSRQRPHLFRSFIGSVAPLSAVQHGDLTQNLNHPSSRHTLNRNTIPQQNYKATSINNFSGTTASLFPSNYGNANSMINLNDQSGIHLNGQHNKIDIAQQTPAQLQLVGRSGQPQALQIICSNQGQTSGGHANSVSYSTINHYPATSQRFFNTSQSSNHCQTGQSHSSHGGNRVQYTSHIQNQPSPYRMENNAPSYHHLKHRSLTSNQPCPPSYIGWHCVQNLNQNTESGLPRNSVQPQTPLQQCKIVQVSGHHSKPSLSTVPAFQGNTQLHVLQQNYSTSRPQIFSQVTDSSSKPTGEAPPSILTESTLNFSKVNPEGLRVDGTQVPIQRHGTSPLSCYKDSFTTQGQQLGHNSNNGHDSKKTKSAVYCNAPATLCDKEIQRVYQTPVQRTAVLKENVHNSQSKTLYVQSSETWQNNLHTDTNPEGENGQKCNNSLEEVQYSEDIAETLEVIKALQKVHQQPHRVVAVVPPISQQVASLEKKDDVTANPDDSLPFKIDAVGSLVVESKNVEQCSNALNLPEETFKKLQQLFLDPHPKTQDCEKHNVINSLIFDTQSTDISQSVLGPTTPEGAASSTVLTSNTPKDHNVNTSHSNCSTVDLQQPLFSMPGAETQDPGQNLTSKTPEGQSIDETLLSNCDKDDLSKLKVHNFTLENFNKLVTFFEGKVKTVSVGDVEKCLLDLYYEGNKRNISKQIRAFIAEMSGLYSKVSIEDVQKAKFQYLHSNELKKLPQSCHILKNDTILPTEEFRSSWLNVDGQPADIETVNAEPILELNFTDYGLKESLVTLPLGDCSEYEVFTKTIPAATDKETVEINNELASLQICHQTSNIHKLSEKHEDSNVLKPTEQNGHLHSKTIGTVAENKTTESEQACKNKPNEDISSLPKITEFCDLSNEDDSSSDFELMEVTLWSLDDARTLFNELSECNVKKDTSQLCQDETKMSATSQTNDLCSLKNQRFTCPHMTDSDQHSEHFCSRCWEETPVLNLAECLFSTENGSPTSTRDHKDQSCSPISGSPNSNCIVPSESNSQTASLKSKSDASKITVLQPDLNPIDVVESCTLLSGKSPVTSTMSSENQVSKTTNSVRPAPPGALTDAQNFKNVLLSVQNKSPKVSSLENQPHKNFRLSKSQKKPVDKDLGSPAKDDQECKETRKDSRNSPIKQKPQINAPQSSKSNTNITNISSETGSDSINPLTNKENASALSGTSAREKDVFKSCMPIEEQACKHGCLSATEFPGAPALSHSTDKRKSDVLSQTTTQQPKKPVSKYPPCKKVKATAMPTADDLFTPDLTVKKVSSKKSHSKVPDVTPTKDGRHPFSKKKKEEKPCSVQLTIQCQPHSSQSKTQAPINRKASFPSKPTGQIKEMEKMRFALYGSKNVNRNKMVLHECSSKSKLSTAPVYITVLDSSETPPSYTDRVSAKQKVYSQWSSTFVTPKTSSHKRAKNLKGLLESRMEALRNCIKDRLVSKQKQLQNSLKDKC